MTDLRQQLQAMKKQTMTDLDQSRKSSDLEKAALRQAQEALELKESSTANARDLLNARAICLTY
jgi:hypothetical protein